MTIAQNIREAAINWPQFLGDIECGILDAFVSSLWDEDWEVAILSTASKKSHQARIFMLLVAEALES